MKKLYFSTFVEGLEKPIEAMLHKEGGVAVERVLSGAARIAVSASLRFLMCIRRFRCFFR